ncbi:hypothetical protein BJY01DRAFT_259424 [Aspergillus pseudoustus]|uniref:Polyketide synthase n=1 Tax=Aspergillus pseudoustus TaxID=1810923 RepID=A0ABR4J3S4_9EURO
MAMEPIAIVGTSCRFPGGATSQSRLWDLLKEPRDVASAPPPSRFDGSSFYHQDANHPGTTNAQQAYYLSEDPRLFDGPFFHISASEAGAMDPQQRQLLETVFESVEAAGMRLDQLQGSNTGVFCGVMGADWGELLALDHQGSPRHSATGTARSILANRISYFFDWHGPSTTVDTACSSSLVALHQAVTALQQHECPVAIAAGTNLMLSPYFFITTAKMTMLSPEGRSRMWDANANGYARGEGVASLVLKRLRDAVADGDPIECVIRATGVNQDGRTLGLTMPSAVAQQRLIETTYARAGLDPRNPWDRCQFFEAHGTGTAAGDPQEASAIHHTFFGPPASGGQTNGQPEGTNGEADPTNGVPEGPDILHVGSIKTVIGHTEGVAGLAGIIKASLSMQNRLIAPNMLFEKMNPVLEPYASHLKVPTKATPWPALPEDVPRRVSVNSFGFGGTNAHAILESYEPPKVTNGIHQKIPPPPPGLLPFVFSAAALESLPAVLRGYERFLRENPLVNPVDFAATLLHRRSHLKYRLALTAATVDDLISKIGVTLEDSNQQPLSFTTPQRAGRQVIAIFTGQGAQWPQMGHDIISSCPMALEWLQEMQASLDSLPAKYRPTFSMLEEFSNASADLTRASLSQPLCTALQVILVRCMWALGVSFKAVVGHSSGEIAAAYAAGFLAAGDAIRIAYLRGLVASQAGAKNGQHGAMLAAGITTAEATEICEDEDFKGRVSLAASNAPASVTLSGDADAIQELEEELKKENRFVRALRVDTAYHSHHMYACAPAYKEALDACQIQVQGATATNTQWYSSVYPGVPMNTTGHKGCLGGEYWVENMVSPVSFSQALGAVVNAIGEPDMVLELGPHPALKGPAQQVLAAALPGGGGSDVPYLGPVYRGSNGLQGIASVIGEIWAHFGVDAIDITVYGRLFNPAWHPELVKGLPNYPFNHTTAYSAHKRMIKEHLHNRGPPNPLLGSLEPSSGEGEWRWRNYLRQESLPWLNDHRVQSQMVFPGTGYICMALEAAGVVAGGRTMSLVKVEDFIIHHGIVLPEDNPTGVETLLRLSDVHESKADSTTTGVFQIDACTGESLQLRASGRLTIDWGAPDTNSLGSYHADPPGMHALDVDRFYEFLSKLGYSYTGPFREIQALHRQKDLAFARLSNVMVATEHHDGPSSCSMLLHPAVLDTTLQVAFATLGAPDDGEVFTLLVPTRMESIVINPAFFCGLAGAKAAAGSTLLATAALSKSSADGISSHIDLFSEQGECLVQITEAEITPLQQPLEDRRPFSRIALGPVTPYLNPIGSRKMPESALLIERSTLLYLKFVQEELTAEDRKGLDLHRASIVSWIDHVLELVRDGRHAYLRPEWLDATREDLDNIVQQTTGHAEAESTAIVFANLVGFIRGEKSLLEELRRNDTLTRFYESNIEMELINDILGEYTSQIIFRFPRMKILEIGAGTGSATRAILNRIGTSFHSYTFTDISVAFFEDAKATLAAYEDRMIYKALDIEQDPIEQGFGEHSYDLIVASNVLHATKFMKRTMERVRCLLKPGGYLVMQETTNSEPLTSGFTVCGFEGWWAGRDDGRIWGPMVSVPAWDRILRDTGFSGVDTYTCPWDNPSYSLCSAIVSQAMDTRLQLLREPLAPYLLILGGTMTWAKNLVAELAELLTPRFSRIIHAASLDSPELTKLSDDRGVTILSLADLWWSWLTHLTEDRLRSMQRLIALADKVLWVTVGLERDIPQYGLSRGWLKSIAQENTRSRYQYLNIATREETTESLLATTLMRLVYTDLPNDYKFSNCVHSTELELWYRNGTMQIGRLHEDDATNDRYVASRRHLAREVNLADTTVSVGPSSNGLYVAQLAGSKPQWTDGSGAGYIQLRTRYSTAHALPITKDCFLHLVIGEEEADPGVRLLALADRHASSIRVPRAWTWKVPAEVPTEGVASFLKVLADIAVAGFLVQETAVNSTLLIHEATDVFRAAVRTQATGASITPHFTTMKTTSSSPPDGVYALPPRASPRALLRLIPRNISVAACLSVEQGQENLISHHLKAAVPNGVRCFTGGSIYQRSARFAESNRQDPGLLLIERLKGTAGLAVQLAANSEPVEIVDLTDLPTKSIALGCVVNWERCPRVSAEIQPPGSLVKLSANKTYLLAGMAGDTGQSIASWMVSKGARRKKKRLTLCLRDLTNRQSVMNVFSSIQEHLPPFGGVLNGALILEDIEFLQTSLGAIQRVMGAKVQGTLLLDEVCGPNVDLDFFIVLGSMVGVFGNGKQSAYASATCFQSNLIHNRRSRGLVGSIVHLGVVNGMGTMNRLGSDFRDHVLTTSGSLLLSERDIDRFLAEAILAGHPESAYTAESVAGMVPIKPQETTLEYSWDQSPLFWGYLDYCVSSGQKQSDVAVSGSARSQLETATTREQIADIITASVTSKIRSKFSLASDYILTPDIPLRELGMDSLVAVDLRRWFIKDLGVEIPLLQILNGDSIGDLTSEAVSILASSLISTVSEDEAIEVAGAA